MPRIGRLCALNTEEMSKSLAIHFLRTLFLAALFRMRAFLMNLSKRLCHVINVLPNFKANVNRGTLRSCHRDTIAGTRVDLDDFLLF